MGTWSIKSIPGENKDILIQGNYNGLNILEKKNGVWSFKNKLEGFDISSRYFEFSSDTTILVSHEYKGVYTLALDLGYTNVSNVKKHTSVTKGSNSSIAKFYDRLLYANEEGVYFLDTKTDTFLK